MKITITKKDHVNAFIKALSDSGIHYALGAGMVVTTDAPYIDKYGIFGDPDLSYDQVALTQIWRALNKNKFRFDLENRYIRRIMGL